MIIRPATLADVPQLVEMGRAFRLSVYAESVAENVDQMAETAASLITGDSSVIFVSEGRGGELTGMIGLLCHRHFLSGALTVSEAFWWADQPGAGMRLYQRGRQWALERGAVRLQMVQPLSDVRVGDLYQRLGFRCVECAWELDLQPAEAVA